MGVIAEDDIIYNASYGGDESSKSFYNRGKTTLKLNTDTPLPNATPNLFEQAVPPT